MFRAVLDTCTLVPSLSRDFLLQLATEDAYAPLWGTGILVELDYTLERLHALGKVSTDAARRRHLLVQMQAAFPGAQIDAPKDTTYDYGLDDPDDEHVAHTAIIGKADAIVSDDRRAGFATAAILKQAGVETLRVPEFVANTVAAHPEAGAQALRMMAARHKNPPRTPEQILDQLVARYMMDETSDILRPLLATDGDR